MGSLCLGRSHFSTWSILSARLVVSRHIEKQILFQARLNISENFSWKEATSIKVQVNLCSPAKAVSYWCATLIFN